MHARGILATSCVCLDLGMRIVMCVPRSVVDESSLVSKEEALIEEALIIALRMRSARCGKTTVERISYHTSSASDFRRDSWAPR